MCVIPKMINKIINNIVKFITDLRLKVVEGGKKN